MPNTTGTNLNVQAEAFTPINANLQQQISEMIASAINTQGRALINSLIHPENDILKDEVIEEQYRQNMEDLDRIPDVVRCLREFSGNATEYSSWKKNVERILSLYESKKGTPKYFGILSVIRNKIIGNADQVLEAYNTPLNWLAIVKCLNMHYADKRDIGTLEYQMTTLVQGSDSVEEFYQRVYSNLSLILNKISCAEFGSEATVLLTGTYREKALDTFMRGLNGDLPNLLAMREPTDLPQALQLCLKLQNQNFRANHANNIVFRNQNDRPQLPFRRYPNAIQQQQQLPLRRYPNAIQQQQLPQRQTRYQQQPQMRNQQQPFYPQLAFIPSHNNLNQQNNRPLPLPRSNDQQQRDEQTPMDVDQTMYTQRINYANRNAISNPKRPASTNNTAPRKQQRTFNLETENARENYNYDEEFCDEANVMAYDLSDVNFLD